MLREKTERVRASGVTRLVEAERVWQESLAAARASADAIVARAGAEAQGADDAARREMQHAVDEHRAGLETALAAAVRDAEAAVVGRAERYANASEAMIEQLAREALAHAPWFVAVEADA
jgi:F0F1-type ATP synthase membrane subunit b/b'